MATNKATDQRPPFLIIEEAAITDYDLGPFAGWLYVVIVKFINRKNNDAFPGIATLAQVAGMTEPTVIKYIKVLEEKGLIEVTRSENKETKEKGVNHYKLPSSVTRGVVNDVYQGGKSDLPGVVNDVNSNHISTSNSPYGELGQVPSAMDKKPRKPPTRSPIFITLAREGFKVFDVTTLSKETVILINKQERWLKDNSPGATTATLMEFYKWYDKTNSKAARPQDIGKFAKHFDAFKQQALAASSRQASPAALEQERLRKLKMQAEAEEQARIQQAAQERSA